MKEDPSAFDFALAWARARWHSALDRALRQNKTSGTVSEKTMREVEEAERKYNELRETKRDRT
jgi:hypothetical protein